MNLLDITLLAVALAMDCFTVSIVSGVIVRRWLWRVVLPMSLLFGAFQALMPFLGWLGIRYFSGYLQAIDHWIAFGLLVFIGGRMVKESFEPEEEHCFNPSRLRTQVVLAVATSIDALAVGISFACVGYASLGQLALPLAIIGGVSFLFAMCGYALGLRFGKVIEKRLRPELVGGLILIAIGVKVLATHLLGA